MKIRTVGVDLFHADRQDGGNSNATDTQDGPE
jgi:hypothetical protein